MSAYDELLAVWVGAPIVERWAHLPPAEAVARAWVNPGPERTWHALARRDVLDRMPLLAISLDRLVVELGDSLPAMEPELWVELPKLATVACREVSCRCGHLHQRHAGGGGRCRAQECRCDRFVCSCRGVRDCRPRPAKRL